jgi:hypothetical protein
LAEVEHRLTNLQRDLVLEALLLRLELREVGLGRPDLRGRQSAVEYGEVDGAAEGPGVLERIR